MKLRNYLHYLLGKYLIGKYLHYLLGKYSLGKYIHYWKSIGDKISIYWNPLNGYFGEKKAVR